MIICYHVKGISMTPAIKDGDILLIGMGKKYRRGIKIGDIIVFKQPKAYGKGLAVKRVNGISGNGYFVLGDNTALSVDSRQYGLIHKSDIKGVLLKRIENKADYKKEIREYTEKYVLKI